MTRSKDSTQNLLLVGLLATFLSISVWYSVMIPPGEAVDEVAHLNYVRYVKEHRSLPVQPMTPDLGVQVWMGHHPPLYLY